MQIPQQPAQSTMTAALLGLLRQTELLVQRAVDPGGRIDLEEQSTREPSSAEWAETCAGWHAAADDDKAR
jgi:hypothetical protein